MPTTMQMKRVLQAYLDAINARDPQGILDLFAPDAVIEDPIGTKPKRGAEIESFYRPIADLDVGVELAAPIRGSSGHSAAMAFTVEIRRGDERTIVHSLDVMDFNADCKIVAMRAYNSPDDTEHAAV